MRNKRAILYDMLFALEEKPLRITHLMYFVNIPPSRLKQYLVELRKRGLVAKEDANEGRYLLTSKGRVFCSAYRQLTTRLP